MYGLLLKCIILLAISLDSDLNRFHIIKEKLKLYLLVKKRIWVHIVYETVAALRN